MFIVVLGCLGMGKRIMNKLFSCADEANTNICYQGTDSIHSNYDDVVKVVAAYKGKYGLELVGEDLGNFHVDLIWMVLIVEPMRLKAYFLVGKLTSIFQNQLIKMVRQFRAH